MYLLDDPLAAVDVHVARHLYNECIAGLLRHKTRILVTHHVHFLHSADFIIVLGGGKIQKIGLYSICRVDFSAKYFVTAFIRMVVARQLNAVDLFFVTASQITYIVSEGTLNYTQSLTVYVFVLCFMLLYFSCFSFLYT